jgi:hypothetical protein
MIKNNICGIESGDGVLVSEQEAIKKEAENYFGTLYKALDNPSNISDQCKITELFTQMLDEEEALDLFLPMSL